MGLYTFMPLGLRSLRKLEAIIDQEMAAIGLSLPFSTYDMSYHFIIIDCMDEWMDGWMVDCQKLDMPLLMNKELWAKTGRWTSTGDEMIRVKDRKG
jgi:prolyl-tRNA synthetase